jgi:hypothetical protein
MKEQKKTIWHTIQYPESYDQVSKKQMLKAGLLGIVDLYKWDNKSKYVERLKTLYFFKDRTIDDINKFKKLVYK